MIRSYSVSLKRGAACYGTIAWTAEPLSMPTYLKGAIAGVVGTIFHTIVMLTLHRCFPRIRRRRIPPAEITAVAAARADIDSARVRPGLTIATALTHVGYGALTGA